jgi:hypothetical protein
MVRDLMATPAMAEIIDGAYRLYFSPDASAVMPKLKLAVAKLPNNVESAIGVDILEMAETVAGLLAHPDVGNATVDGLDDLNDDDIVVLRDYVLGWPAMCLGLREALATLIDDPQARNLTVAAGILARYTASFSTSGRQTMLGFFIARARAKPAFLASARNANRMRVGPVLHEAARRQLLHQDVQRENWESALEDAGVAKEHWSLWLGESGT